MESIYGKEWERLIYDECERRGYFGVEGNKHLQPKLMRSKTWGVDSKDSKSNLEDSKNVESATQDCRPHKKHTFCIMMPPPNVTGVLHIGHALTFTLQDIIVRFKRMQGFKVLWQPGLDHAGIATQNVVEKQLLTQGITKQSLGREAFIKKVWEWKESSGGQILGQMRSMGFSPDFSRTRFTMDDGLAHAVRHTFVSWYEKGLIYRGERMINWCTHDGALSDIEVDYKENVGRLYYLRYEIVDSSFKGARHVIQRGDPKNLAGGVQGLGCSDYNDDSRDDFCDDSRNLESGSKDSKDSHFSSSHHFAPPNKYIIVATTRPETFFGDVAVMVNPQDSRFNGLIGKKVRLPLINKEIPIIADSHVDMDFGSGAVKVTPAHDINDYEVGIRHGLERVVIFDTKGILNEKCGEFAGLERLSARDDIVKRLDSVGAIEKIQEHANKVGTCYRCGNVIEPYISKQWFVSADIAKGAIERVERGEARFFPSQWQNNYNAWMRDLKDWCISRQLWWGHRIPVFYCECGCEFASVESNPVCPGCRARDSKDSNHANKITQDPDVLDTWFSSALWSHSTLGFANGDSINGYFGRGTLWQESDLSDFHPNSLLITGFDILFFWVARMLMATDFNMGQVAFKDIYLHALVLDSKGQKMSKSKGNVIDPLELCKSFSPDIVRFSLAFLCVQGRDIKLSQKQLEITRNFTNKIINAMKFIELYAEQLCEVAKGREQDLERTDSNLNSQVQGVGGEPYVRQSVGRIKNRECDLKADTSFKERDLLSDYKTPLGIYMKSRLNLAISECIIALESYRFDSYASVIYRFLWSEFCDIGVELTKADKMSVFELSSVLAESMKLLHPLMPFLSEYVYHRLLGRDIECGLGEFRSIMVEQFPFDVRRDMVCERTFEIINDSVKTIRRTRVNLGLTSSEEIGGVIVIPLIAGEMQDSNLSGGIQDISVEHELKSIDDKIEPSDSNPHPKPCDQSTGLKPHTTPMTMSNSFLTKFIAKLAKVKDVEVLDSRPESKGYISDIGECVQVFIESRGLDLEGLLAKLNAQESKLQKEIVKLDGMLKNEKFLKNAPQNVVETNQNALKELKNKIAKIEQETFMLKNI